MGPVELDFGLSHYSQLRYLKDFFKKGSKPRDREKRIKSIIQIKKLTLSSNYAKEMPSLRNLHVMFPNLQELDLSDNSLKTI